MDRYDSIAVRSRRSIRRDFFIAVAALIALSGALVALAHSSSTLGHAVSMLRQAGTAVAAAPAATVRS